MIICLLSSHHCWLLTPSLSVSLLRLKFSLSSGLAAGQPAQASPAQAASGRSGLLLSGGSRALGHTAKQCRNINGKMTKIRKNEQIRRTSPVFTSSLQMLCWLLSTDIPVDFKSKRSVSWLPGQETLIGKTWWSELSRLPGLGRGQLPRILLVSLMSPSSF